LKFNIAPSGIADNKVSLILKFTRTTGIEKVYVDVSSSGSSPPKENVPISLNGATPIMLDRERDKKLLVQATGYKEDVNNKGRPVLYAATISIPP